MHTSVNKQKRSSLKKFNLTPIERTHYKSLMKVKTKQHNFLLDCTNTNESKLPTYSYLSDKYLTYFVVRLPKKIKMQTLKDEKKTQLNSSELKRFIQKKKNKILKENQLQSSNSIKDLSRNKEIEQNTENYIKNGNYMRQSYQNKIKQEYNSKILQNNKQFNQISCRQSPASVLMFK